MKILILKNTKIKQTKEGWFSVEIETPSADVLDRYYSNGDLKVPSSSKESPRVFKKAKIKHTFDEVKFPTGSVWMMGESPGMKINFFGEKLIMIQEKDLYARLD